MMRLGDHCVPPAAGRVRWLPAVVSLVTLTGCGDGRRADQPPGPQAGWTVYHDARAGFSVEYPSGWHRAGRSLTPALVEPRELLSVGTGPLRVRETSCAHFPTAALEAMGPSDALVSVQERRRGRPQGPPRPRPFRLGRADTSEIAFCIAAARPPLTYWRGFTDRGRQLYVLVALGRGAAASRRREVLRILDSLRLRTGRA
jgi:hypothetical protein